MCYQIHKTMSTYIYCFLLNSSWHIPQYCTKRNTGIMNHMVEKSPAIINWNDCCVRPRFCTVKAILGWRQPGRMRWILLWTMPLAQDQSLDVLVSSPGRYHCTTDAYAPQLWFENWVDKVGLRILWELLRAIKSGSELSICTKDLWQPQYIAHPGALWKW